MNITTNSPEYRDGETVKQESAEHNLNSLTSEEPQEPDMNEEFRIFHEAYLKRHSTPKPTPPKPLPSDYSPFNA